MAPETPPAPATEDYGARQPLTPPERAAIQAAIGPPDTGLLTGALRRYETTLAAADARIAALEAGIADLRLGHRGECATRTGGLCNCGAVQHNLRVAALLAEARDGR